MSEFETIIYEKQEHIGFVTLNRPRALNAYSTRMRDDLYEVLGAIKDDDDVRAVIFRGAGDKAFCGGADLTEFLTAPSAVRARQIRFIRDMWGLFLKVPQPLIAAIHGYCLGSGLEIAMSCDIRIAADDAVFGLPEVGLGIIPGAGGTQTLPRAIGLSRSLDMVLTNRWIHSDEAYGFGLVSRVVPKGELPRTAQEMAQKIASFDPAAVRKAKQAVLRGFDLPLPEGFALEKRLAASLAKGPARRHNSPSTP